MEDAAVAAEALEDLAPSVEDVGSTGVSSVDAALEQLRDLDNIPVEGHVEVFDDVQRRLHDALAELDDSQ